MVKAELWEPLSQPLIAGVKKSLSCEFSGLGRIEKKSRRQDLEWGKKRPKSKSSFLQILNLSLF